VNQSGVADLVLGEVQFVERIEVRQVDQSGVGDQGMF
jgi:hypothetical protein